MKTRLDKLNDKLEELIAKKQKLEARQREKLADLFLGLTNKGVNLNALAGLILNAPQLITSENEEAWQIAGKKFLGSSRGRKALQTSSTPHSSREPETTPFKEKEPQHGL